DFKARPATAASVDWDNIEPWLTLNEEHTSVDIKAIIQEITSRAGWVPGNSLVVFLDSKIKNSRMRIGWSYDRLLAMAPQLEVTYAPSEYVVTIDSDPIKGVPVTIVMVLWRTKTPL
ncbi:unnamed protein product, partial [marine sediment metagenome]